MAITELVKQNYELYLPMFGNTDYDMVASKDGSLYRVQVKSTTVKKGPSWIVRLATTKSNRTENVHKSFDSTRSDLLVVSIIPENLVIVLDSKDFDGKSAAYIRI